MKIDVSETGSEAGGTCYCLVSCSKLELSDVVASELEQDVWFL
jgi:hypothetical protein